MAGWLFLVMRHSARCVIRPGKGNRLGSRESAAERERRGGDAFRFICSVPAKSQYKTTEEEGYLSVLPLFFLNTLG
jgi:hypothetical protein